MRKRKQKVIPLVFREGLSGGDPRIIQSGFTKFENGIIEDDGRLVKRNALSSLDGLNSNVNYSAISEFNNYPIVIGDEGIEVFDGESNIDASGNLTLLKPGNVDGYKFFGVEESVVKSISGSIVYNVNSCINGEYLIIAYNFGNDIYVNKQLVLDVYNKNNLMLLDRITLNGSAFLTTNAIALNHENDVFVFYPNEYDYISYVRVTNGSIQTPVQITSAPQIDSSSSGIYHMIDACLFGASNGYVFICYKVTGFDQCGIISFKYFSGSTVIYSDTVYLALVSGDNLFCSCFSFNSGATIGSSNYAVLVARDENEIALTAYDINLTAQITSGSTCYLGTSDSFILVTAGVSNASISASSGYIYITYSDTDLTPVHPYHYTETIPFTKSASTFVMSDRSASFKYLNFYIYSKPFVNGGNCYCVLCYMDDWSEEQGPDLQQTLILVVGNTDDGFYPVGKCLTGIAIGVCSGVSSSFDKRYQAVSCYGHSDFLAIPGIAKNIVSSLELSLTESFVLKHICFNILNTKAIKSHSNLLIPSSIQYEFDGTQIFESGFLFYIGYLNLASAAGGSSLFEGVYSYKVVFHFTDNNGNLHRSAPSPAYSITINAEDTVTISFPWIQLTYKNIYVSLDGDTFSNFVVASIYRTAVNGSVYYKLADITENEVLKGIAYYDDIISDYSLSTDALYTDSGEVENVAPPSSVGISTIFQSRHFLINSETKNVQYSKEFAVGLAVSHSDVFTIKVNDDKTFTAIDFINDKLILFKEKSIYATYGEGLSLAATGQGFVPLFLVSNMIGCNDHKKIVHLPNGIIFDDGNGISALDENLQIKRIGDPIQYYYDNIVSISSAVHNPKNDNIIFLDSSSNGMSLVYNYKYNTWGVYTIRAYDGIEIDNKLYCIYYTDSAYLAYYKNDEYLGSESSRIAFKLETGWISFDKIGGRFRLNDIYVMGYNLSNHSLSIKAQFDFDPVWETAQTFDATSLEEFDYADYYGDGLSSAYNNQAYVVRACFRKKKCSSFRLQITDTPSADNGLALNAIIFVVSAIDGAFQVDSNRSV